MSFTITSRAYIKEIVEKLKFVSTIGNQLKQC